MMSPVLAATPILELPDIPIDSLVGYGDELLFTRSGPSGGEIWSVAKRGGKPARRLVAGTQFASAVYVDAGFAYFLRTDGAVCRVPASGSTEIVTVITAPAGVPAAKLQPPLNPLAGLPCALLADGTSLFWIDIAGERVLRAAKAGGPPKELATRLNLQGIRPRLGQDDRYVYFGANIDGRGQFSRVSKQGNTPPEEIARIDGEEPFFFITSGTVVWLTAEEIVRVDGSGKSLPPLHLLAGDAPVCDVLADERGVVYSRCSNERAGVVVAQPWSGGSPRVLATNLDSPRHLVGDGDWIYFVEEGVKAAVKSTLKRIGCCSILAVRR